MEAPWKENGMGRRMRQLRPLPRVRGCRRQRGRDFSTALEMTKTGNRQSGRGQSGLDSPIRMTGSFEMATNQRAQCSGTTNQ